MLRYTIGDMFISELIRFCILETAVIDVSVTLVLLARSESFNLWEW